ncbi:HAD family hydrolase [Streptacidiphilus sp. NEAU-YB345]|uniref:HAD family hydrolase n=2 Tax=Streptacidiphilus fuscans TaxID=2789292 RepID=A0A931FGU6_9ACTN|nr:HAD family hydrolase [Streptacidiphilus fuscans]MBF9072993.1 HAD family hydrolase [Streptacidiphilus fuscans]
MTLLDTRPGIARAWEMLAEETGVRIDSAVVVSRLGPPVEIEMAHWFPADEIKARSDRYRQLYAEHGVKGVTPLPGAIESLAAVRAAGGRTLVVTGKHTPNARLNLDALGIEVDALHGDVFASAKAGALRAEGASVYVGDHLGDIEGARQAEAVAVGVTTGPYDAAALRAAGADVVLADLTGFPAWLQAHLRG